MPQLSIYLDKDTMKKIGDAAKAGHLSLSKWVRNKLTRNLKSHWPEDYFELFGALKEGDIERPAALSPLDDSPRESL